MSEPVFIRNARFVLTMDGEGSILENSSVRIENGMISDVGEIEPMRGDEIIEGGKRILMPGLVNSHTHAAMILLRGLNDDAPLDSWLESMWAVEGRLTPEVEEIGAEMAFLEMIRSGTTACLDMYGAFEAARAAEKVGLRLAAGPPLISVFGSTDDRLDQAGRFLEEFRDHPRIKPVVNLHSIYTNDEDAIKRAADLSRDEDLLLNVHCSETRKEVFENRKERGRLAVEELDKWGALMKNTVLVHLGWASSWEFEMIGRVGASTVHCPNSNQKLGTGGFFPYRDLSRMGVKVGLGTDSAASNNSLDMFREMKAMALLQKGQYWDPTAATALDSLFCATSAGSDILGIDAGRIEKGRAADLVMLNMDHTIMPLRRDNLASAVVYSATGHLVDMTIVNGEILYSGGNLRDGTNIQDRFEELADAVPASLLDQPVVNESQ